MGATSSIVFCICNKRMPFCVVLYVWSPSYSIKPFSTKSAKYSLSWLKDRYALYINFVFVAPPPFAASKISPTMSLLLLYFILHIVTHIKYLWETELSTKTCVNFYCTMTFIHFIDDNNFQVEVILILYELFISWVNVIQFILVLSFWANWISWPLLIIMFRYVSPELIQLLSTWELCLFLITAIMRSKLMSGSIDKKNKNRYAKL